MAKQVNVTLTDDLDGETPADTTVEFALDGINYEIDLADINAAKLRADLAKWVDCARKTRVNTRPRRAGTGRREELAPIRAWAEQNGITVPSRGRIPDKVVKAFWERDKTQTVTVASKAKARRVKAALDKVQTTDMPEFSETK